MIVLWILNFYISMSSAAVSEDCQIWFKEMKFVSGSKDCDLKCTASPKNIVGAFCDCKDLCKEVSKDAIFAQLIVYPGLNKIEKNLIAKDPKTAMLVFFNKRIAEKTVRRYFPVTSQNDESDAFRHFLWAGLLTFDIGSEKAKLFLNAHEQNPIQPADEKEMDEKNNEAGILAASKLIAEKRNTIENLEKVAINALDSKKLSVIKPGTKISKDYK